MATPSHGTLQYLDQISLASVILYDYQDRRFQRRRYVASDHDVPHQLWRLEEALFLLRTRLSASLARIRILHDAPSLRTLLPADIQPREATKNRPLHGWINNNKIRYSALRPFLKRGRAY